MCTYTKITGIKIESMQRILGFFARHMNLQQYPHRSYYPYRYNLPMFMGTEKDKRIHSLVLFYADDYVMKRSKLSVQRKRQSGKG